MAAKRALKIGKPINHTSKDDAHRRHNLTDPVVFRADTG